MASCKAVRIHSFGGPEVLQIEAIPMPEPAPNEVLIRVHAASVNPVDYKSRSGSYPALKREQLPVILGRDVAGTIETSAAGRSKGEEVFVFLPRDRGGYAEYVAVPADIAVPKPRKMDMVQAAAVPLAAMTAWQGLFDHGGLQAGQRVLIHGGSGGVGHFAVQFAKARGAHVITTVSGQDVEFVRSLGADQAIDYKSQRFEDAVHDADLVLDLIAGETQQRSWAVLKRGGTLISTLQKPDQDKANSLQARAGNFMAEPNAAAMREIAGLIDAGRVKVHVDAVFPLDEVQQAHRKLEHEHVRGKIALRVV